MSEEFFSELENKIDALIYRVQNNKSEKDQLCKEIEQQNGKIQELELQNQKLREEIEEIKNTDNVRQKKWDLAEQKIQGLLLKLESLGPLEP